MGNPAGAALGGISGAAPDAGAHACLHRRPRGQVRRLEKSLGALLLQTGTTGTVGTSHEFLAVRGRNRLLSILSVRIFDSSVERGIPSRSAAPACPNIRPPLARRASSMIVFSWVASELKRRKLRLDDGRAK